MWTLWSLHSRSLLGRVGGHQHGSPTGDRDSSRASVGAVPWHAGDQPAIWPGSQHQPLFLAQTTPDPFFPQLVPSKCLSIQRGLPFNGASFVSEISLRGRKSSPIVKNGSRLLSLAPWCSLPSVAKCTSLDALPVWFASRWLLWPYLISLSLSLLIHGVAQGIKWDHVCVRHKARPTA